LGSSSTHGDLLNRMGSVRFANCSLAKCSRDANCHDPATTPIHPLVSAIGTVSLSLSSQRWRRAAGVFIDLTAPPTDTRLEGHGRRLRPLASTHNANLCVERAPLQYTAAHTENPYSPSCERWPGVVSWWSSGEEAEDSFWHGVPRWLSAGLAW
jgi:hypothetical protein